MIKIVSLVDNISSSPKLKSKHGLSVYVETPNHKILFDVGPDSSFLRNANQLGIDLSLVDTVIISHGHFDHGGGLEYFWKINNHAKIYVSDAAFDMHYIQVFGFRKFIGIDTSFKENPNVVLTGEYLKIDRELTLFSGITERKYYSGANDSLFVRKDNEVVSDCFRHEQYLIVNDGENQVLLTGCSHAGIVNILEKFNRKYKSCQNLTVIGGFHLYDPSKNKYEDSTVICAVSDELKQFGNTYYTCHCTGKKAYELMKTRMDNKLMYLSAGRRIEI